MKRYQVLALAGVALAGLTLASATAQTTRTIAPARSGGTPSISSNHWSHGGNWSGGYRHHHHGSNVYFGLGLGYPFGFGYPYGYGSYPFGYGYPYGYGYGYDYYSTPVQGQVVGGGYGSVVVQVQQRLARAGYYRGAVDGVIGGETRRAIRAYERAHGL